MKITVSTKSQISQSVRSHTSFALGSTAVVWQMLFFYVPLGLMILSSLFKISTDPHRARRVPRAHAAIAHVLSGCDARRRYATGLGTRLSYYF